VENISTILSSSSSSHYKNDPSKLLLTSSISSHRNMVEERDLLQSTISLKDKLGENYWEMNLRFFIQFD